MLKNYLKSVKRLSTDEDGVVSFEYVIVAACIIAVVAAAFGTGRWGSPSALSAGLSRDQHGSRLPFDSRGGIGMSQCPTSFKACI